MVNKILSYAFKGKALFIVCAALTSFSGNISAQNNPPMAPDSVTSWPTWKPQTEFVMQLCVTLGQAYTVGETPHGRRIVIPITGGTFSGPRLKGTILPGGADYQLATNGGKRTELEAIYSIKTDDGTIIHVRNRGLIANTTSKEGQPQFYFMAAPIFETSQDSPYAWLADALYVCEPDFTSHFKGIVLNVWKLAASAK